MCNFLSFLFLFWLRSWGNKFICMRILTNCVIGFLLFYILANIRYCPLFCYITGWQHTYRNCCKVWIKKSCGEFITFHFTHSNYFWLERWRNHCLCKIKALRKQGKNVILCSKSLDIFFEYPSARLNLFAFISWSLSVI